MEKLFGPDHFEGLAATWSTILAPMRSDPEQWCRQSDVVTAAVEAGCNAGTVTQLLSSAFKHDRLERRGSYGGRRGGRRAMDTREVRPTAVTIQREALR